MKYFDLGEQSIIQCEACLHPGRIDGQGFDLHHLDGRGKDKDVIENLMALCRDCHRKAHEGKLSKEELQYIHNSYLSGKHIKYLK